MLKRYWLFGGCCYYAAGGVNDFIQSFDTLEEAVAVATELTEQPELDFEFQWWHVCDMVEMTKVVESEAEACGSYGLPSAPTKLG